MSRSLSAALLAALTAGTVRPALFFEGEYSTGTLRLWSGVGPITWDGETWTGAGDMLSVDPVTERSDISAVGFAVSLTGDADALLSINLGAARQGLTGSVWIGAFDEDGSLIADPYKAFSGRLDVPEISDSGETCKITVSYESRLIDLDRTRERRYTHEDQKLDYPTDTGFRFMTALQNKEITWGRPGGAPVTAPAATSSGNANSQDTGGGGAGGDAGGGSNDSFGQDNQMSNEFSIGFGYEFDPVGAIEAAPAGSITMGVPPGQDPTLDSIDNPGDPVAAIEAAVPGSITMGDAAMADSIDGITQGGEVTGGNVAGIDLTSDAGNANGFDTGGYAGADYGGADAGGGGGGGGGKIICTELYRQGIMPKAIWEADQNFGRRLQSDDPLAMLGYRALAKPVVAGMRRSSLFTVLVARIALPWAAEMAHQMGVLDRGSRIGALLMTVGLPVCRLAGICVRGVRRCV